MTKLPDNLARTPTRRFFALISILAAVVAALSLAPPASAVLSGKNGRIVFTSGRADADDSKAQLYVRTMIGSSGAGTVSQPIGVPGVQNRHASWSPDRTKIVFAAGTPGSPATEEYDLFIRDLEENTITPLDLTQIGDGLSSDHPAWSPDGTRIAYEQQPTDNSTQRDIMVKTIGTSKPAMVLSDSSAIEFKPAWSPDSEVIYYASQQAAPPASNLDIMRRVSVGGPEVPVTTATGIDEYQPSISPDGSKICFTLQTTTGDPSSAEIYTASLPSMTGLTNISDHNGKGDINCTWSPDGRFIAYSEGVFSQARLVMERSDDSDTDATLLEDDSGSNNFDGNADWAPDGSPDCPDSTITTAPDTPVTVNLECTDTGPAYERTDPSGFVANGGAPQHGTLSDDDPTGNPSTVLYTPDQGFTGTDRIVFTSFDAFGFGTDEGTVTIKVKSRGANAKCAGIPATITGTRGDDVLTGTAARDVIVAGNGNDRVRSGRGPDVVCAGKGRDRVAGNGGGDRISGGAGNDRLSGGGGDDRLRGAAGRDRCRGGSGTDRVACERGHSG